MRKTRKLITKVRAGGKIEIAAPDLREGQTVEVTVRLPGGETDFRRSIKDILAQCRGGVLFKTAEQVDEYIRQERDSWDD